MIKLTTIVLFIPLVIASHNALACDDKACEKAYLSSTPQYVSNYGRQAQSARAEREAHALNRERRDYALHKHLVRMKYYLSKSIK